MIFFGTFIICLELVQDHEGKIAEGQRDVLLVNEPIVVLVVKPVPLFVVKDSLRQLLPMVRFEQVLVVIGCDAAPLLVQN